MGWKQGPPALILSGAPLWYARGTWGQQENTGDVGASPTLTAAVVGSEGLARDV